jgi:hypothetical protein
LPLLADCTPARRRGGVLAGVYISTTQNAGSPHFISERSKLHRFNSASTIQANFLGIAIAE